jgi:hypothetical protein
VIKFAFSCYRATTLGFPLAIIFQFQEEQRLMSHI